MLFCTSSESSFLRTVKIILERVRAFDEIDNYRELFGDFGQHSRIELLNSPLVRPVIVT